MLKTNENIEWCNILPSVLYNMHLKLYLLNIKYVNVEYMIA